MPALDPVDFETFMAQVSRAKKADPTRVAKAGLALVDGALRIRRGGLYGDAPRERPVTKPAEAVGAWLKSMEREIGNGQFHRTAELREALVAAGEEADVASRAASPMTERLRNALYSDALTVLGTSERSSFLPWVIVSVLSGILIGVFAMRRKK